MLYHVVLLKLKAGATEAEIAAAREAVVGLRERIPGIESIDWGPNTSPEGLAQGYDIGVVMRFAQAGVRDVYLPHPDHQAIVPYVLAVAETVLVFDVEAAPTPTEPGRS